MSFDIKAPKFISIVVFTFLAAVFLGPGWFGPKVAHSATITLYPTANATTGTVTNPTNVYGDDSTAALISSNASSETARTFNSTNLGTISDVTVWVKYKTTGLSNDTYAFDAAVDGATFNQSILVSNATSQAAYTTVSKSLGALTWAQVGTLAVKCTTVKVGGADGATVDWDVAYIVVTYTVKTDQTITVGTPAPSSAAYNSQFTVAATASSGLDVIYSSGSTGICTNSGATFTMVSGTGTCVVQYNQAGDAAYNPAPQVTSNTTATKIDQATVTVSAPSSAAYGQTGLSATATGGSSTGTYSYSAGSSTGCSVNPTNGALTFTSATGTCNITATRASDNNYNVSNASSPATVTITTASLTVTAAAKSKTYGAVDPALTYNASGFVNGDTSAIMSGALSRVAGSNVGDYAITQGTVAATSNYTISYTGANLTVTAATLTVAADAKSKIYGEVDPALTYAASGFVNGDTSVIMTGALSRVAGENVGDYAISQGTVAATNNYTISYTGANLTVTAAPLTVTADAKSKTYGESDPSLTYTPSGFVNGDTIAVMTGALSRAAGENVGDYAVSQGTVAATSNYTITYTSANLTINAAPLSVTAEAKNKAYGEADPALTYNASGFVNGDTVAIMSGSLTRAEGESIADYAINQGTVAATSNYIISYTGANLTITAAGQSITVITPAPASAAYLTQFTVAATADSSLTVTYSSGSPGVCTNSGDTFTMISGTGACIVRYDQEGDANYSAAPQVSSSVTADKTGQTINPITLDPATLVVGGTTTASTLATSGLPVVFSSSTPAVCTVTDTTVTGVSPGVDACTIIASQTGNTNYNAAPNVEKTFTVDAAAGNPTLSVTITGNGSVNSVPSGIACTSGTCSAEFTSGQSVELTADPSTNSDFAGWGGACSASGTNPVCTVVVSSLTAVTADFTAKQLVRVGDNYYASMQDAYNNAGEGAVLKGSIETLFEHLNFNLAPNITFDGGYDATWVKVVDANTTVSGSVTLSGGSVTISNLVIE